MSFKDALDILSNLSNIPRSDELKIIIYDLQKENLDLQSKLMETESKLKIFLDWTKESSLYKKHKTPHGSIIYIKIKETIPDIFYCPVCFDEKSIIPLQPITHFMNDKFHCGALRDQSRYCPSCEHLYYL